MGTILDDQPVEFKDGDNVLDAAKMLDRGSIF